METFASAMEAQFHVHSPPVQPTSMMTPFAPITQSAAFKATQPVPSVGGIPFLLTSGTTGEHGIPFLPKTADIPVEKFAHDFQETMPDPSFDADDCNICQDMQQYIVVAETTFKCAMTNVKNLRDKANSFCFKCVFPDETAPSVFTKFQFKLYASSTIKRGKKTLRRNCLVFGVAPDCIAHVSCCSPQTGCGSLKWNDGAESFLAFEDQMSYSIRVLSRRAGMTCRISGDYPVGALVLGDGDPVASKRQLEQEALDSISKKIAIEELHPIEPQRLVFPDFNAKASTACVGYRIASYSFVMRQVSASSKNLRQRAAIFDIVINAGSYSESHGAQSDLRHLKWKAYADSTIKRGKKSLRRNDFVFRVSSERVVNVFCRSPADDSSVRAALKWTVEKQEQFLAFEAGLEYCIQVFSTSKHDDVRIFIAGQFGTDERIDDWRDELHPERSLETARPRMNLPSMMPTTVQQWQIEPSIWNMSYNADSRFIATIIAPDGAMPEAPLVVFYANDRQIQVVPLQYDNRLRKSFLIEVPPLFSAEKAQVATSKGVQFVRKVEMHVLNDSGVSIWTTTFVYEVGDVSSVAK